MKKLIYICFVLLAGVGISCSGDNENSQKAYLNGNFSVSDSSAYSDIRMFIFDQDSSGLESDTLANILIGEDGSFYEELNFKRRSVFNYQIVADSMTLIYSQILLSGGDTLKVTGNIPGLEQSLDISSSEYKALKVYNRVNNQYKRVTGLIAAGAVADSMITPELEKWSNSFWEVYETYPGSFAADLAFVESVKILNLFNKDRMYTRIEEGLPNEFAIGAALNYGTDYVAMRGGLERAVSYLDSLENLSEISNTKEAISRVRINILYDSSEVKRAKDLTDIYEEQFGDNTQSMEWIKSIRYDLNYLAPGVQAPEFNFVTMSEDTVSNEKLTETVYLLEISPLAAGEYQREYNRMIAIHEIYKNYGLKIFTIPLDESPVTIEAFYESRGQHWPVAKIGSFDVQELIQNFNITQVPTWILIDKNGEIVRKYVRSEITDVIDGLGSVFSNPNSTS